MAAEPISDETAGTIALGDRCSADVLAVCQRDGLAFIPWFPLEAGRVASPAEALAWLLAQEQVLPIPGTGKVAHLEENVEAARSAAPYR